MKTSLTDPAINIDGQQSDRLSTRPTRLGVVKPDEKDDNTSDDEEEINKVEVGNDGLKGFLFVWVEVQENCVKRNKWGLNRRGEKTGTCRIMRPLRRLQ